MPNCVKTENAGCIYYNPEYTVCIKTSKNGSQRRNTRGSSFTHTACIIFPRKENASLYSKTSATEQKTSDKRTHTAAEVCSQTPKAVQPSTFRSVAWDTRTELAATSGEAEAAHGTHTQHQGVYMRSTYEEQKFPPSSPGSLNPTHIPECRIHHSESFCHTVVIFQHRPPPVTPRPRAPPPTISRDGRTT